MSKFSVIIAAAGKSTRFKDENFKKPFIRLDQKAVWLYSAEKFLNRDDVNQVILIIAPEDREDFFSRFGPNVAILGIDVVDGGNERADSVQNALAKVNDAAEFVAVHDAARPCITDEDIEAVFVAAQKSGAAILATPVSSTLKVVENGTIKETVARSSKWLAQTPQVFRRQDLIVAYQKRGDRQPTDEAELMETAGHHVTVVKGSPLNIKITTKRDLMLAKSILKSMPAPKLDAPAHPFADGDMWR
ncbi:MAG: 2-C-methyl-D-erythritol 4-phosphate cytidylyltransferase [Pirellulaceae bacterium]